LPPAAAILSNDLITHAADGFDEFGILGIVRQCNLLVLKDVIAIE
jgi:hypothetical protein